MEWKIYRIESREPEEHYHLSVTNDLSELHFYYGNCPHSVPALENGYYIHKAVIIPTDLFVAKHVSPPFPPGVIRLSRILEYILLHYEDFPINKYDCS